MSDLLWHVKHTSELMHARAYGIVISVMYVWHSKIYNQMTMYAYAYVIVTSMMYMHMHM